jgi:hypothetical protein
MSALRRKPQTPNVTKRFGPEADVETLTGFSRRTLQKDRLFGRSRFPHYKVGGKILYDLDEVEAIVKASRVGNAVGCKA